MPFAPTLDAEQCLLRLLALIRGLDSVAGIDAARLRTAFGVDFDADENRLGYGERLSRDWWTSFEWDPGHPHGPRFEFAFVPDPPGAHPPATAICAVDFDRFAAELAAMGFSRETIRGEHGRVLHDDFERGDLSVTVYTRGEADDSPERIAHSCVRRVAML
jgi:hypothetical protein